MQESTEKNIEKNKNIVLIVVMAFLFLGLSFLCWLKAEDEFSESERRVLARFPEISVESILDGQFMKEFETYSLDQFPFRDRFRSVKAITGYNIFKYKDNNDIYIADGYLSKQEYPIQLKMLDYGIDHMEKIYNTYLKEYNSKCYFTIVPDKNFFLARKNGHLSMDYDTMFSYMRDKMYFTEYVDITGLLSIEDYYKTDTHWRQEKITDVADCLKQAMGTHDENDYNKDTVGEKEEQDVTEYEIRELETPFYGVYCGQSALPVKPDKLYYLNNSILEQCRVTSYDSGKAEETVIYNMEKAEGKDAYEIFLSGASALQVIENPNVGEKKELIVFRDSFGSSLVPLLVDEYSKITVIDTRYVQSSFLGNLVDFHGQDVLFIYSTLVLNNSMSMR